MTVPVLAMFWADANPHDSRRMEMSFFI